MSTLRVACTGYVGVPSYIYSMASAKLSQKVTTCRWQNQVCVFGIPRPRKWRCGQLLDDTTYGHVIALLVIFAWRPFFCLGEMNN